MLFQIHNPTQLYDYLEELNKYMCKALRDGDKILFVEDNGTTDIIMVLVDKKTKKREKT